MATEPDRRRERWRRVALVAGSTLLALAIGEFVARAALRLSVEEMLQERHALAGQPANQSRQDLEPHPYYGYVLPRGVAPADREGFPSNGREPPYRREPREFVIGLFGASVAAQVASAPGPLLDRLTPVLRARGFQRVSLRNFTIGGWRQPQTFDAIAQNAADLDLIVSLDGFNEVHWLGDERLRAHPASDPGGSLYGLLVGAGREEDVLRRAKLIRTNRSLAKLTARFDGWPLRGSGLAHLVWRLLAKRKLARADRLRRALDEEVAAERLRADAVSSDEQVRDRRDRYHALLEHLIRASQALADTTGTLYFDFIQPNLHDAGAKPLSAAERRLAAIDPELDGVITGGYRRLDEMVARLQKQGVRVRSLTRLFADVAETRYVDSCCHFVDAGVARLGEAMAEQILASHALDRVSPRR
jgi:hypothetical protein